jgi:hypothetical protein
MFYFLVFNSSISKTPNPNKRMLTTLLYGTVAYICFHAILSSSKNEFLSIIQQYFWMFIIADLGASIYMYNEYCDQKKFKGNVFTQFMNVFTKFMDGILSSKVTGISYGLDEYDDSDNESYIESDSDEDNDSDEDESNSKENFKNKKKHKKSKKKSVKNGILKRRVSFNNEESVKHFQKNEIISSDSQNTIPVKHELQNTQNEMSELNKQLLALQKQQEQDTQPKMGTSISAIRNKQVTPLQNQTQTAIPSLPTSEINAMVNNTDQLLKNKDNIKNEDLVNMKLNYDPNVNINDNNGNVPNLKLDNFVENPITELEKDNSAQVNELFKSYSNNLSGTSTDVKENFQQQMEQFNKQKEELLKKQMSNKDQQQNVYNPALPTTNTFTNDTQSVVSSASDLGSVMDFDMDDFANTI